MDAKDKPLVWLHGEVKTPPLIDVCKRRLKMYDNE